MHGTDMVTITREQLISIVEQHGTLGDKGFDPFVTKEDRDELKRDVHRVGLACEVLSHLGVKKTPLTAVSSYGLKHIVEENLRERGWGNIYIAQGSLIAAAIHLGIPYRPIQGLRSVVFCVTMRSVRRIAAKTNWIL